MDAPMDILILEDEAADAELVKRELRQAGLAFTARWTQDKAGFLAALGTAAPDLILADYSLPGFDGLTALALARRQWADVPVIIVSGAIGEEVAIDALKAGATDYVLKQRLSRLGPVVQRALAEARERSQKRHAEEALREANATLESKVTQRTAQLQHRARQLQKLTLELSLTEDRERKRMADILHDDLQQQLAAAKFHLSLLCHRLRHQPEAQAIVAKVDEMLHEAVEKSRSLSHDLSPAVLYQGDLGQTFEWLARQMQTRHGLLVRVRSQGEVHVHSDALKAFLYKAGQEFLFNVVKHARVQEAGVRLRRLGCYVVLQVGDGGRGFDPRGLQETAGFGLFSIRERVELLGGHMQIRSAPGQGSTFLVVVPDGPAPERHRPRTNDRGPQAPDAGRRGEPGAVFGPPLSVLRVLLADDHEVVRQGLRGILSEAADVEVVGEAANGREAVDLAGRLKPDVVIMDVSMPLISGDEATRQLKAHLPDTRVIALSMYDEPERIETMHRAGAEAYVLKTAPSEELLAAVRGAGAGPRTDGQP